MYVERVIKMKKSKGIVSLILTVVLLCSLAFVGVVGVGSDGTGAAKNIKLGLDLAGGVSITYQVVGDEEPDATDMSDTIAKLQKRVEGYSTEAIYRLEFCFGIGILYGWNSTIYI